MENALWFGFAGFIFVASGCSAAEEGGASQTAATKETTEIKGTLLPIHYNDHTYHPPITFRKTPWYMCTAKHPMAYLKARTLFRDSASLSVLPAADGALEKCRSAVVSMGGWDPDKCAVFSCEPCEND